MAISFNTSTTATVQNSATASGTIVIPAGVLSGDLILVLVQAFTTATGTLANSLTSTATAPVAVGSAQSGSGGGAQQDTSVFKIVAGGSDAGATLTYSTSGGTGGSYWYSVILAAYTGASGVDVSNSSGTFGTNLSPVTSPTATTGVSGDWQVQLMAIGVAGGTTISTPASLTSRGNISTNQGVSCAVADSNASVGAAGTGIGGTSWTYTNFAANTWTGLFTVGIAPAGAAISGTVQPRATVPVPRHKPSRAVVGFTPVMTVNTGHGPAGTVQSLAAQPAPRRKPARAVVQFIPVKTVNNLTPPAPTGPPPNWQGVGRTMLKKWLQYADL